VFHQVKEDAEAPEVVVIQSAAIAGADVVAAQGQIFHEGGVVLVAEGGGLRPGFEGLGGGNGAEHAQHLVVAGDLALEGGGIALFIVEAFGVHVLDHADDEALQEAAALVCQVFDLLEKPLAGAGAHDAESRLGDKLVHVHLGDAFVASVKHIGDFLLHAGVVVFVHFPHPGAQLHLHPEAVGVVGQEVIEARLRDSGELGVLFVAFLGAQLAQALLGGLEHLGGEGDGGGLAGGGGRADDGAPDVAIVGGTGIAHADAVADAGSHDGQESREPGAVAGVCDLGGEVQIFVHRHRKAAFIQRDVRCAAKQRQQLRKFLQAHLPRSQTAGVHPAVTLRDPEEAAEAHAGIVFDALPGFIQAFGRVGVVGIGGKTQPQLFPRLAKLVVEGHAAAGPLPPGELAIDEVIDGETGVMLVGGKDAGGVRVSRRSRRL